VWQLADLIEFSGAALIHGAKARGRVGEISAQLSESGLVLTGDRAPER
jgi:hypothetical protein